MPDHSLQERCERGQAELVQTLYLQAARTLAQAEQQAWDQRDFDTLSRLYLPLQEARRQIRQRCGDGAVALHCLAQNQNDEIKPEQLVAAISVGQLLVGGWGNVQPAIEVRRLASAQSRYLETFLAAVYPLTDAQPVIVIFPLNHAPQPTAEPRSLKNLQSQLPTGCLLLNQNEIPPDAPKGNADTFASVMDLWDRLHRPLLDAAALQTDHTRRMQAYRDILRVDPACELAHQFLADIARKLARENKSHI